MNECYRIEKQVAFFSHSPLDLRIIDSDDSQKKKKCICIAVLVGIKHYMEMENSILVFILKLQAGIN